MAHGMKSYYVYVIQCFDGTYYVGVTNDVKRRFFEHQFLRGAQNLMSA